ncbi:MAG TPA: dihydrofolate reductase family protein [Candidatus Saccharimonadia bacterium]|nr:dihydrofolate reductase family protein [Candidatus Saccharimonadia bacterium]
MRKIIAALQTSLDGLIEGPNGELDWVETWEDCFEILPRIDACILGRKMYPGYEQYWRAILANPKGVLEFTGRPPHQGEIEYAHFADKTPHYVLSTTLERTEWKNTHILRDLESIRKLKEQPGKDMHAVGGATLVGSLLNAGLVDELRIVMHPMVLGEGTPLFKDVKERHGLKLREVKEMKGGIVRLTYVMK